MNHYSTVNNGWVGIFVSVTNWQTEGPTLVLDSNHYTDSNGI